MIGTIYGNIFIPSANVSDTISPKNTFSFQKYSWNDSIQQIAN